MSSTISVIVPIYNAENYVNRCIESVLDQTYCNWQMILVDDGSKDKSLEIYQKYADVNNRISVIHQENAGPSIARNAGIAKALGNYVVFIDSDNYIEKDYFQLLAKHDKDAAVINARDVDKDERVLKENFMAKNKNLSIETILRR